MISLTEANPNDLAFQPLACRPAQAPPSYRSRAWRWVKGAPNAMIRMIWARKEAEVRGEGPFAILSKDLKASIFQFLDLRDLAAASLVSKEWNVIVGTYVNIWGRIALQIKCPLESEVPSVRLQTIRFIRELQECVRGTFRKPVDLTKLVKVSAPSISDLNTMRKLLKARDALVVWGVLAKQAGLPGPELEKLKTLEEIFDKAKKFGDWILENKEVFDQVGFRAFQCERRALSSVPKQLCNLTAMTTLVLSNNQIRKLPEEIAFLKNLEFLALTVNKLSDLPPTFNNLAALKSLFLGNNQFRCIPPSIFALDKLEKIGLNSNKLTEVPEEICGLKELQELYLSCNQLTKLPEKLIELTNLQKLTLQWNQLTSISNRIRNLPNLKSIELWQNPLPLQVRFIESIRCHFNREISSIFLPAGAILYLVSTGVLAFSRYGFFSIETATLGVGFPLWLYTFSFLEITLNYPLKVSGLIAFGIAGGLTGGLFQLATWLKGGV